MNKCGSNLFDRNKIVAIKNTGSEANPAVTLLLDGGHTLDYEGEDATKIWNEFSKSAKEVGKPGVVHQKPNFYSQ